MGKTRANAAYLERLRQRIAYWETRIREWRIYDDAKEGAVMSKMKATLRDVINGTEKAIAEHAMEPTSDPAADRNKSIQLGARLKTLKEQLGDIENTSANIEHAENEINKLRNQLKSVKEGDVVRT